MVNPEELKSGDYCCEGEMNLAVYKSAAGYYIGTWCYQCGPYSRHSQKYWKTKEEAQKALDSGLWLARAGTNSIFG